MLSDTHHCLFYGFLLPCPSLNCCSAYLLCKFPSPAATALLLSLSFTHWRLSLILLCMPMHAPSIDTLRGRCVAGIITLCYLHQCHILDLDPLYSYPLVLLLACSIIRPCLYRYPLLSLPCVLTWSSWFIPLAFVGHAHVYVFCLFVLGSTVHS